MNNTKYQEVSTMMEILKETLKTHCTDCRERSLAMTNLDTASLWIKECFITQPCCSDKAECNGQIKDQIVS